jgi:hypothetical protein
MILLCGIPSETPLVLVATRLQDLGVRVVMFNQRRFAEAAVRFEVENGQVTGELWTGENAVRLEDVTGVYTRLMDDQLLPELRDEAERSPLRVLSRGIHDAVSRWYEIAPARVVNRTEAMGSNFSKPYQAQIIRRHGFEVPETLVTNDPDLVREFLAEHGRLVYKSVSGVRSIVQLFEDDDLERLDRIRWCPVQFQAFIDGTNVRVHTVGVPEDGEVFATRVTSDAVDYRYGHRDGADAVLSPADLPDEVAESSLRLAESLGLPFSGIDLKIARDGRVFCFEVNPSPAYSYYELSTGQPISITLARYLAGI